MNATFKIIGELAALCCMIFACIRWGHLMDTGWPGQRVLALKWFLVALFNFIVLVLCIVAAHADPPPGADPSLAPWFRSLHSPQNGWSCCDMGDCRTVRVRNNNGKIEAWIDQRDFKLAPDKWVSVPDDAIIRGKENPMGEAVACWWGGRIRCFVPGSGA